MLLDAGLQPNSNCGSRAIGYRQGLEFLQRCHADPAGVTEQAVVSAHSWSCARNWMGPLGGGCVLWGGCLTDLWPRPAAAPRCPTWPAALPPFAAAQHAAAGGPGRKATTLHPRPSPADPPAPLPLLPHHHPCCPNPIRIPAALTPGRLSWSSRCRRPPASSATAR